MSSCLIEMLNTAFGRFSELGVCISQTYDSQQGGKMIYLKCPIDKKLIVDKYLNLLIDLSSAQDERKMSIIENQVNKVTSHTLTPLARL